MHSYHNKRITGIQSAYYDNAGEIKCIVHHEVMDSLSLRPGCVLILKQVLIIVMIHDSCTFRFACHCRFLYPVLIAILRKAIAISISSKRI